MVVGKVAYSHTTTSVAGGAWCLARVRQTEKPQVYRNSVAASENDASATCSTREAQMTELATIGTS